MYDASDAEKKKLTGGYKKYMKIGIYGGSFNPMHYGHTGLSKWVIDNTDLDELWLMVSPNNPLKDSKILGGEEERLKGAKEAIAALHDERIKVSDFEFSLPRPSYTAETLRQLRKQYPEHEFVLVIGEDNWAIFDQWRDWEEILRLHQVYIYPRHPLTAKRSFSDSGRAVQRSFSEAVIQPKAVYLKDAPLFDISSTEIRNLGL